MAQGQPKQRVKRGEQFAKRNAIFARLSKRIGWLNQNGKLAKPIKYEDVKDLLGRIGDNKAMQVLKDLENKASEVRDPTAYVVTACKRAGGGGGGGGTQRRRQGGDARPSKKGGGQKDQMEVEDDTSTAAGEDAGAGAAMETVKDEPSDQASIETDSAAPSGKASERERVEAKIQELNSSATLQQELQLDTVLDPLVGAGIRVAFGILKRLEREAAKVEDPSQFVVEAVEKSISKRGSGRLQAKPKRGAAPTVKGVRTMGVLKRTGKVGNNQQKDLLQKIQRRISWLNSNGQLASPVNTTKVAPILVRCGKDEAMNILKNLEENAAKVRDPTGYVSKAAKRMQSGEAPLERPNSARGEVPPERQLRQEIGRLNKEVFRNSLRFDRVEPLLLQLPPENGFDILRRLEEKASSVQDPTAWVVAAAKRSAPGMVVEAQDFNSPRSTNSVAAASVVPEMKLQRRVDWLNDHVALNGPLDYDRVSSALMDVGYHAALEILNDLEENAGSVRDPNGYVIAAARRATGSAPARAPPAPVPTSRPVFPPTASLPSSATEDRLFRRVEWLNRNVCPQNPLDFERISPHLLQLPTAEAMALLKDYEEQAGSINDPTGFIAARARRALAAKNGVVGVTVDGRQSRGSSKGAPGGNRRSARGPSSGKGQRAASQALPSLEGGMSPVDEKLTFYSRSAPEQKIRNRIDWLNSNVVQKGHLDYSRVVDDLVKVGPQACVEILKQFEEHAKEVRDPTAYVVAAIKRQQGQPTAKDRARSRRSGH